MTMDNRFAHLLAPADKPPLPHLEMLAQQRNLIEAQYGAGQLSAASDRRLPVVFSDDGVAAGPLGAEKWFPYGEAPSTTGGRPTHEVLPNSSLWIGRAVFTAIVLSTPDRLFTYDELFSVAGLHSNCDPVQHVHLRREIRQWWKDHFTFAGASLVLGAERHVAHEHMRIRANPAVSARVTTTLGWDSAYSERRRQFTPQ